MQKISYVVVAAMLVAACSQKDEQTSESAVQTSTPSAIEAASAGNSTEPITYNTGVADPNVKLNPPHGEPGHICEIPVGDPLPSDGSAFVLPEPVEVTPVRPTPINPGATSLINQPINTVVPTGPKPKFNPPHGQPWHTCDLEVGAPLN